MSVSLSQSDTVLRTRKGNNGGEGGNRTLDPGVMKCGVKHHFFAIQSLTKFRPISPSAFVRICRTRFGEVRTKSDTVPNRIRSPLTGANFDRCHCLLQRVYARLCLP